jgi:uncharacterized damage-inducible protein DinB
MRKPRAAKGAAVPWGAVPPAGAIQAAARETYEGPAWHGPSVLAALRGVGPRQAAWRPAEGRNTIHELVLHLAYTRHLLLRRLAALEGRRVGRFPRKMRTTWFPEAPEGADGAAWKEDLSLLAGYQNRLIEALGEAGPAVLARRRRGKSRTIASELLGLAFHDAYHAGQIRLLTRIAPPNL